MSRNRIVIEPGTADSNYWKDLWNYRGLFYFLAWRDILVRYKQTVIGVLWSVLRPLLTVMVMAFIGWLFNSATPDNVPRLLLVSAATLPWQFFSNSFSDASNSLLANSNLLTKVYFPRLIVPASTVIVCLIDFAISFVILIGIMVYYQYMPDLKILMLPLFLLLALITSIGTGLYIAALNVKYRDFRIIVPFIVQFGLYVSPIAFSSSQIYNSDRIPQFAKYLYSMNPMVSVIDGFRWSILRGTTPIYMPGFLLSAGISLLFLIIGVRYFRKMEKTFADVI
ncbi:MAG: phosphate transporter permease [Bacteroidetes bacterium]|nr:phosphate transporter permease [Bacteroidota bacterium]